MGAMARRVRALLRDAGWEFERHGKVIMRFGAIPQPARASLSTMECQRHPQGCGTSKGFLILGGVLQHEVGQGHERRPRLPALRHGAEPLIDQVREELRCGAKRTHWLWFVFPQIDGLGFSRIGTATATKVEDVFVQNRRLGAAAREGRQVCRPALPPQP